MVVGGRLDCCDIWVDDKYRVLCCWWWCLIRFKLVDWLGLVLCGVWCFWCVGWLEVLVGVGGGLVGVYYVWVFGVGEKVVVFFCIGVESCVYGWVYLVGVMIECRLVF